jgi:uncharacterized membrane protein
MPGFKAKQFLCDEKGAISIIAALALIPLLAAAALVIDVGTLYYARRNLQAATDAAALAAVRDPLHAQAVAQAVFTRNGYSDATLTVTGGVYSADEALAVSARFVPGNSGVNAVQVRATRKQRTYLAPVLGLGSLSTLATTATAARLPTASFGAGTRLAALDNGLANAVLGRMLGSSLSLSAIDYESLLNTNIDALTFLDALAVQAGVSGSYRQLAQSNVNIGQILTAAIQTIDTADKSSGDTDGALLALKSLQAQIADAPPILLSNIVDLSPLEGRSIGDIGEVDGTGAAFNVMSLISASARTLAAGRLIDLGTALKVPGTNTTVTAKLAVGAPFAQIADGQVGARIRTAQIRMAIDVTLADLDPAGIPLTVTVPIYLEAASGAATLTALPCTRGGTLAAIAATTGAATLAYGSVSDAQLADFTTAATPAPAPIVSTALLGIPVTIAIQGGTNIAAAGPASLTFTQDDIDAGTIKSASAGNGAPFTALGGNLALSATILGDPGALNTMLNNLIAAVTGGLAPLIANVTGSLDMPLNSLLTTLGLSLGTMDVRVFGASCRAPVLVG